MQPAFSDAPWTLRSRPTAICWLPMAKDLKAAGLSRITVSMDAVDPETFTRITRVPGSFEKVRDGIRAAQDAGLGPVKVNCVLLRGFNDSQIEAFAEFSRNEQVIVRFIECMPLEEDRTWSPATVVPMKEILARLNAVRPRGRAAGESSVRDGAAVHLRRWARGDWHHCAGVGGVLRPLQPRARDLGWQAADLPVLAVGPRPGGTDAARRNGRGDGESGFATSFSTRKLGTTLASRDF
jgi:hypothetical protein